jgi:hypothetical protein
VTEPNPPKPATKLDDSAKIVSMISIIVGLMISGSSYFASRQLQKVQAAVADVDAKAKSLQMASQEMDNAKKEYDLSARLSAQIVLPLARSFALQYADFTKGAGPHGQEISFLTTPLADEFKKVMPGWAERRGLMTGESCKEEGLKTRQIVTLTVANIGHADATDVKVVVMEKPSPLADSTRVWHEAAAGAPVAYQDLPGAAGGWTRRALSLRELRGASSPEKDRNSVVVVLASVSSGTSFFGTVQVPMQVTWTDRITKKAQSLDIMPSQASTLRSALIGAEIGTPAEACRR